MIRWFKVHTRAFQIYTETVLRSQMSVILKDIPYNLLEVMGPFIWFALMQIDFLGEMLEGQPTQ